MTSQNVASILTGKQSDFLKVGVAAAGRGDVHLLEELLRVRPEWLNQVGSHGRTMIWEAAYRGKQNTVELLLAKGSSTNTWGCHFTPLLVDISPYCAAAFKKHHRVANLLESEDETRNPYTQTYLGHLARVTELLQNDPTLVNASITNHHCPYELTLVHYAIAARQAAIVNLLLEYGSLVQPYSEVLVRYAIWRNMPETLETLIEAGVDLVDSSIPRGGSRSVEITQILQLHGIAKNVDQADGGWPPLVFICRGDRGGNLDRVKELLDAGADINVRNYKGQAALHCAAKAGFIHVCELLIQKGADVNAIDQAGKTPLITILQSTIKNKSALREIAELLINAGANPDLEDHQGLSFREGLRRRQKQPHWRNLQL